MTRPDPLDYPPDTPDWLREACDAIHEELWTFQWAYPNWEENRGEVSIDTEQPDWLWLRLDVWVPDNDTPEDSEIKQLVFTQEVRPLFLVTSAREQIRSLIHNHLTHEADEQMFFGPDREMTFDPHARERAHA